VYDVVESATDKEKQALVIYNYFFFSSPLALQPAVGFGLSNNIPPFFPVTNSLHL
jgi:hypothetical protein